MEKEYLEKISKLLETEISPLALTYKLNVLETDFPVIKLEFDISEIENIYFVETEKWIEEEKSDE